VADVLIRSYSLDGAQVDDTGDGRTLLVRAVPWNTEARIGPNELEVFDPAAFNAQMRAAFRLPLTLGHPRNGQLITDTLIGRLESMVSAPEGLMVRARVSTTQAANDALTLLNDEIIDQVSVGFVDQKTERSRRGGMTVLRRMSARLDHLALVPTGAYGEGAKVLAIREEPQGVDGREYIRAIQARIGSQGITS
jgi:uncharacterized protein